MSADDVVDIRAAPLDRRRRRMWLRVGVPIGGVALVIMAILAIALYSARVNRAGVLALSDNLLAELQAHIGQQVADYLDPATRSALLARDMTARNTVPDRRATLEAYAASTLRQIPQIDAFYVGDAAGNFMMVRRGADGGTDTKLIRNTPGARRVEWIHQGADGRVTGYGQDLKDEYDPRTRDWYQGALKTDGVFWTGVYVFFTDRTPGVTASIRYHGPNNAGQVFGVDITLKALSSFLASLQIGRSGRAVIFGSTGHLIAAADVTHILRQQNGKLVAVRLDQLGDPAITAAYDRFRVEGYGRRMIQMGRQNLVSIVSRLPAAGHDWSLLIVVPEKDFTGFVTMNSRRTLALSMVVIALTALLAALLVRQGLRADRTARQLLDRGRAIEQQGAAFADLAHQPGLFDPTEEAPLRVLTEMLAGISAARRASLWRLIDARILRCEDAFESDSDGHVAGLELSRDELPEFFAALMRAEVINVSDAANDRRTAELHRVLMHPMDSRGLFVLPVPLEDGVAGTVILEDAAQVAEAQDFLRAVVNMLAVRMRGTTARSQATYPASTETAPATVAPGERSFTAELALRGLDTEGIGAEVFPAVAVMVIKFSDPAAMAVRNATDLSVLADRIAAALQDIAASHDIPYMKLVGQDVVAAAGCMPGDTDAILRIADAALAARDRCMALFEEADHPPSFRIGMDFGIVIGSQVGRQPRLFNLWGEAVRTAEAMASTAAALGAIQVSEAAYRRLRRDFLFRPRGSFYLPHVGAAQTFVLGSRL